MARRSNPKGAPERVVETDPDIPIDPQDGEASGDFHRWVNRRWPEASRPPDESRPIVPAAPRSPGSR